MKLCSEWRFSSVSGMSTQKWDVWRSITTIERFVIIIGSQAHAPERVNPGRSWPFLSLVCISLFERLYSYLTSVSRRSSCRRLPAPYALSFFLPLLLSRRPLISFRACLQRGWGEAMLSYLERVALASSVKHIFVLSTVTMQWFVERGFKEAEVSELPPERKK